MLDFGRGGGGGAVQCTCIGHLPLPQGLLALYICIQRIMCTVSTCTCTVGPMAMQGYLDELELVIAKQQHQLVLTVTVITGTLQDLQNLIRFLQAELKVKLRFVRT